MSPSPPWMVHVLPLPVGPYANRRQFSPWRKSRTSGSVVAAKKCACEWSGGAEGEGKTREKEKASAGAGGRGERGAEAAAYRELEVVDGFRRWVCSCRSVCCGRRQRRGEGRTAGGTI